jgi:ferredoxin-nitrite reductase
VNIHLTGCPHSCAQHFIGDIGLLATTVNREDYQGGAFHFFVGGGSGQEGRIGVPVRRSVPVPEVPGEVERILAVYLEKRLPGETFTEFTARRSDRELQAAFASGSDRAEDPDALVSESPREGKT